MLQRPSAVLAGTWPGVATRRYGRAVRLEAGDLARQAGDGTSKSAVSRRFVAMSQAKLADWLSRDLSELDLLVIQIDGMVVADDPLVRKPCPLHIQFSPPKSPRENSHPQWPGLRGEGRPRRH